MYLQEKQNNEKMWGKSVSGRKFNFMKIMKWHNSQKYTKTVSLMD